MSTPHAPTSANGPERPSIHALVAQLQAPFSWKDTGHWRVYLCVVLYGAIAAMDGRPYLVHFLGAMVVVFLLQASNEQRTRRQIDVLVQIVRELERKPA